MFKGGAVMQDKGSINDWLEDTPPAGANTVTGSTVATVGTTSTPTTDEKAPQRNFAQLSPDISFIGENNEQEGAYYAMIQGHKIRRNNTRMRIFLIHSIVDIDTTDAAGLRRIIYQRQHNEIKAGETYQGVKVKAVTFTDHDSLPPIP